MLNKIEKWAFLYFMPLYMISQYLYVRGINTFIFLYHLPRLILLLLALTLMLKKKDNAFIWLMLVFFLYNIFSIVLYAFNDTPISCYFGVLESYLYPMLFAWFGYRYSNDDSYNKMFLFSCLGCFLIGFYLYFTMPSYYVQYLIDFQTSGWTAKEGVTENTVLAFSRFSSFFGTAYVISYLSIPALTISLGYTLYKKPEVPIFWLYFIAIASFVAALLSQMRIAMAYSVAVLLFYGFYSLKANRSSKLLVVYGIVIVLFFSFLGYLASLGRFDVISENILERLSEMDINDAMDQRTFQYALSDRATWWSYIFGLGMGSCGGMARSVGLVGVTDGEWVKMFYEMGFVGMTIFALMVLSSIVRGLKHLRLYYIELIIVVYFLAAGLGSDSLVMNIPCAMFWYSLGRIWNKKYYTTKLEYIKNGD